MSAAKRGAPVPLRRSSYVMAPVALVLATVTFHHLREGHRCGPAFGR